MNQRIKDIADQCYYDDNVRPDGSRISEQEFIIFDKQKFAELIVRECVMVIEDRTISQMGEEGVGWTNGYGDGLRTGAWLIKQHFGVDDTVPESLGSNDKADIVKNWNNT